MEYTRVLLLFVITLLQLCRAEIRDKLPESWYSANVINDGLQLKSISEIFSTDHPSFSSRNPIIVLPKSKSMPDFTLPPSSSIYEEYSRRSRVPSSTPMPIMSSTLPPQLSEFSSPFPSQSPNVELTQYTEQTQPPSESLNTKIELQKTTSSLRSPAIQEQSTQAPYSSPERFLIPIENIPAHQTGSTPAPLSNYFVIYQRVPQNLQGSFNQEPLLQGGLFSVSTPLQSTTTSTPVSTVVTQPSTTASPQTTRITTSKPFSSSPRRPSRTPSTHGITQISTSRPPTTKFLPSTRPTQKVSHSPNFGSLPLRIRVIGPKGSITNVNINPPISVHPSTTKRPTTTTTRRTPKPKKNTYEACLNGCKARRDPICAISLSATWINPEQLKGFPSVCHMACFNSYKKEPYEKLLDGRCGRLRTRIQTLDSKTKLNRGELNKAQYVIDDGDKTIVEVSQLH